MQTDYDVCVIGGGILGCMAARELSRYRLKGILLEKEPDVCCGITKANSAILYAGYDHKPGTLKSELCVRGNAGMDLLCEELDVPVLRCGSLMLGFGPKSEEVFRKKLEQGRINQVPGLELLSGEEIRTLEPWLSPKVRSGLYAPTTGTVNPWQLGIAACENAQENGWEVRCGAEVIRIARYPGGYELEIRDQQSGSGHSLRVKGILNCAGLFADQVREMLLRPGVRIRPTKGSYLVFASSVKRKPEHILFYEPETKGKGLTLVPTTDGTLLAGATEESAQSLQDTATDIDRLLQLRQKTEFLIPGFDFGELIHTFAAVRPNPYEEEGHSIHSFVVDQTEEYPGMISYIGIKTPGLTCCAELAKYGIRLLFRGMQWVPERKILFEARRRSIRSAVYGTGRTGNDPADRECGKDTVQAEKTGNHRQERILCHCAGVTEAEIREAVRRGAVTMEGIRHRCHTGMGKCQGTRCREKISEILKEMTEQT